MPYKKGDVINKGNQFRKILAVTDGIIHTANTWYTAFSEEEILCYSKRYGATYTIYQLEKDGWKVCTPEEAGLPAEKWVPPVGLNYYYGVVDGGGKAISWLCERYESDQRFDKSLAIGNVHKTFEEAIEWAKKRYNIA